MTTPDWTQADEATFNEMQARRAIVVMERRKPLCLLARKLEMHLDDVNNGSREEVWDFNTITDWLIAHADAIRDALAPFDSGVREET